MNSLFGRLGMDPFLESNSFIEKDEYKTMVKDGILDESETNIEDFDTHWLVSKPNKTEFGMQGNVSIAVAISSYSRILMSEVKNRDDINIYYTDTDSIFTDSTLPSELVDPKKLGMWKLEDEYIHGIFLMPKVYGTISVTGNIQTKAKGYTNQIDLKIFEKLLSATETEKLIQDKWFRLINESEIHIKATAYTLKPNEEYSY